MPKYSENKGLKTEQDYNGIISLAELDFPAFLHTERKRTDVERFLLGPFSTSPALHFNFYVTVFSLFDIL